ncbi:MAG: DsrE/DsrF/DrsH-like family protein [Halapricum sp.]
MTGYAIVLASGELERVQAVSMIGSIAAASDVPVQVFATMNGLTAFEKERVESGDFEVGGPAGYAMLQSEGDQVPLFTEQLEQAKELGPLEVYACEMVMDIMDTDIEDYVDVFDGVLGVSGFLKKAKDKQVLFV